MVCIKQTTKMSGKNLLIFGYNSCGYYRRACRNGQDFVKEFDNTFDDVICKDLTSRSLYKEWLAQQYEQGNLSPSHTSSPANFIQDTTNDNQLTFIGGSDDLTQYINSYKVKHNKTNTNGCTII